MVDGSTLKYQVLGLDMGTYGIKTNSGFLCRSVYNENTMFNVNSSGILEHKGRRYQMGVGKFNTEIIKSYRDNIPLFLYAIAKSTSQETVKLVMGLPNYQLENDEYVNTIKEKFIGEFEFKLDGADRFLKVLDIRIFPEGMGAYYTITNDLSNKDVIIIDIGGSTFNVLLFKNNEFIKAKTLPFGSLNLLSDIRDRVLSIYGGRHSIDDIANYMQRGKVGKVSDTMPYKVELAQSYVDELATLLDLEFPKDHAEYFIGGGGVEVFADCLIKNLGDLNLICDYLHANANGFKMIGDVIYNG